MKIKIIFLLLFASMVLQGQQIKQDSTAYKKRVLETTEIDFLMNYYSQDGENAAVTGGNGTEELTDLSPSIIVSVPLNTDDVLTITANISAYTSASSSNINPFDGEGPADPFVASSGASQSDLWVNGVGSYSHSSDNRNRVWSANLSFSNEYDYTSVGVGGSYTWLMNEKNTELSLNGSIYIDSWKLIYPTELLLASGRFPDGDGSFPTNLGQLYPDYDPVFNEHENTSRNSFASGIGFSQILSRNLTGYLSADFIYQEGLLAAPFHRVYFKDRDDFFYQNFHLADDIEQLPGSRFKVALGGRLNYYVNHRIAIRTYFRYYQDDWGVVSNTASIEIPIKITNKFTLYPSYRYYDQTATDYFALYNQHSSTNQYYTSDFDLSEFKADNFGFGMSYTDVFTTIKIRNLGLKSLDLKYNNYSRNSGLKASIVSFGAKFIFEKK